MKPLVSALMLGLLAAACTHEGYESGNGKYSFLKAEFVEAHTIRAQQMDYAVTDNDERVAFEPYAEAAWATKADTLYRALVYYNRPEEGQATPVQVVKVLVIKPLKSNRPDTLRTDPIAFQSLWKSQNERYINIGFSVKTGRKQADEDTFHTMGMRLDSITYAPSGRRQVYITVLHSQNDIPEYYSIEGYMSLPLTEEDRRSTFHFTLNTYKGVVKRVVE